MKIFIPYHKHSDKPMKKSKSTIPTLGWKRIFFIACKYLICFLAQNMHIFVTSLGKYGVCIVVFSKFSKPLGESAGTYCFGDEICKTLLFFYTTTTLTKNFSCFRRRFLCAFFNDPYSSQKNRP